MRKSMESSECKADCGLAGAIDVPALDCHGGAIACHAFDHGGDLRGRAPLELGLNAGRALLHMPVDHDATDAIAGVPFRHQVAVPRAELRCIGPPCRARTSPYFGISDCPCPGCPPPPPLPTPCPRYANPWDPPQ